MCVCDIYEVSLIFYQFCGVRGDLADLLLLQLCCQCQIEAHRAVCTPRGLGALLFISPRSVAVA